MVTDAFRFQISSLESWDQFLFIGTTDGYVHVLNDTVRYPINNHNNPCSHVILYQIDEKKDRVKNTTTYRCKHMAKQRLSSTKPIDQIQVSRIIPHFPAHAAQVVPSKSLVLVLTDGKIVVLELRSLQPMDDSKTVKASGVVFDTMPVR